MNKRTQHNQQAQPELWKPEVGEMYLPKPETSHLHLKILLPCNK